MNTRLFNGNNLPHELLLTTRKTTKLRNAIENNMSTDIKLSEAWSIIKNWISFIKISNKTTWIIGFNSCFFSNRCRIQIYIYGSGTTTLIISNEEMNNIMKIVQALEDSNILLKY